MKRHAQLHLVNAEGSAVSAEIREAIETAFGWVLRDFPSLDASRLADWAETLAMSMTARGSGISSPRQFAYPALRGKVLDSFRKGSAREQNAGIGQDLERIGGTSGSFEGSVERKILFDQLQEALPQRDRDILVLLQNEKSAQAIADELGISSSAARKAIQRVKERSRAFLNSSANGKHEAKYTAMNQRSLAVER